MSPQVRGLLGLFSAGLPCASKPVLAIISWLVVCAAEVSAAGDATGDALRAAGAG